MAIIDQRVSPTSPPNAHTCIIDLSWMDYFKQKKWGWLSCESSWQTKQKSKVKVKSLWVCLGDEDKVRQRTQGHPSLPRWRWSWWYTKCMDSGSIFSQSGVYDATHRVIKTPSWDGQFIFCIFFLIAQAKLLRTHLQLLILGKLEGVFSFNNNL